MESANALFGLQLLELGTACHPTHVLLGHAGNDLGLSYSLIISIPIPQNLYGALYKQNSAKGA